MSQDDLRESGHLPLSWFSEDDSACAVNRTHHNLFLLRTGSCSAQQSTSRPAVGLLFVRCQPFPDGDRLALWKMRMS